MSSPHIYIHRLQGCPYDWYMDEQNEALLASFADVTNDGREPKPVPADEMTGRLQGVTGILSLNGSGARDVTKEAVQAAGTVKVAVISHWWHGSHNDASEAWQAAGVEVIDESDACNEAVAEWTIGAAIAGLFQFAHFDREMKSGVEWPDKSVARQLNGSTFGLVSLGRVGRIVAEYLRPFDVRVIAYDPYVDADDAQQLGVELVDLETLLHTADVVSLHAPVLPETTAMLGAKELGLIRDGALLINSARAALLDGDAFRAEMAKKRFTAYLDVYDPEPPPVDEPLRSLDNVVMTPHIAGSTPMMFLRCGRRAIERLQAYFADP